MQLFVIPISSLIRHSTFVLGLLEDSIGRCAFDLVWFCARSTFSTRSQGVELLSDAGKSCKSRDGSA